MTLIVREQGLQDYLPVWERMKTFTSSRCDDTPDEIWMLEHPPVYTQGQAGKPEHVFHPGNIPLVQSDRGGQVTYHGPGQLVAYVLMDLRRRNIGIRTLVCNLEQILIELLRSYGINGSVRCGAPGVYVGDKKIASLGLRVKNACTYHGLALNVDMDLSPFDGINPCGFARLKMTQISDYCTDVNVSSVAQRLQECVLTHFER